MCVLGGGSGMLLFGIEELGIYIEDPAHTAALFQSCLPRTTSFYTLPPFTLSLSLSLSLIHTHTHARTHTHTHTQTHTHTRTHTYTHTHTHTSPRTAPYCSPFRSCHSKTTWPPLRYQRRRCWLTRCWQKGLGRRVARQVQWQSVSMLCP